MSGMSKLMESSLTLMEKDELATLVASLFGPFYSAMLLFAGDQGFFIGRSCRTTFLLEYLERN
jgi:hypothetical protein